MTEIYLMRHSKKLDVNNNNSKDSFQVKNEKRILSIEGEKIIEKISNMKYLIILI